MNLFLVLCLFSVERVVATSHFITFGTPSHRPAAHRNAQSAKSPGGFDVATVLSPDYFQNDTSFTTRYADILELSRGYGYWSWKPYVLGKYMYHNASENDLVCYSDANYQTKKPFVSYIEAVLQLRQCKILMFTSKPSEGTYPERSWTKHDAFVLMNVPFHENYTMTHQVWAGFVCLVKNFETTQFVHQWLTYAGDERIITDAPSQFGSEDAAFRENRHDQTIASLLMKKWGCFVELTFPETYVYNHHLFGRK